MQGILKRVPLKGGFAVSKPKEKNRIVEVTKTKSVEHYDKIPPFDSVDNDKLGKIDSKERT